MKQKLKNKKKGCLQAIKNLLQKLYEQKMVTKLFIPNIENI